jgi:hypothetical protein
MIIMQFCVLISGVCPDCRFELMQLIILKQKGATTLGG